MGILYFLQPCLVVGSNKYKIGMSSKDSLTRVRSYHEGTIYLCIVSCNNYLEVEKILIQEFKKKYKLICGNEYFEIKNENEALELFIEIFLKYRKKAEIKQEEKSYVSEILEEITDGVKNMSFNWMSKFSYKK
jgi:hypothetical protein